jgi:PilZ domain
MHMVEKRKFPRAPVLGDVVVIKHDQEVGAFRIVNLSAGGVLVAGDPPVAVGERLELILDLADIEPLRFAATVVRRSPGAAAFAIHHAAESEELFLQRFAAGVLERSAQATALVADDSVATCRRLSAHLRLLGHLALAIRTPFDAVRTLSGPNRVAMALVGLAADPMETLELMTFLAHEHPSVRRVLMVDGEGDFAAEPPSSSSALAQGVLFKPWTPPVLARVLHFATMRGAPPLSGIMNQGSGDGRIA